MALKLRKFRDSTEAELFLQGAIIGRDVSKGVVGLVGLTLTFTSPAGSVAFVTANREENKLLFLDIKTQVEAAIATLKVMQLGGRIVFIEVTPASGVAMGATDQVAKSLLGFDQNTAFAGKFYGVAPGTPPAIVHTSMGPDGTILLTTNE